MPGEVLAFVGAETVPREAMCAAYAFYLTWVAHEETKRSKQVCMP